MAVSRSRVRALLLGENTRVSRRGIVGTIGLFVIAFLLMSISPDTTFSLYGSTVPLPHLVVVGLSSAFVYYNEGLLVGMGLSVALVYAFMIHLLHVGMTGENPYPEAAIMAIPWTIVIGGLLGAFGGLLGLGARHLTQ
jgi:hypothetical protein